MSTSKCLIAALIDGTERGSQSLESAFAAMRPQIESDQIFVAARALDVLGEDSEYNVFGAATLFEDTVALLAVVMIDGHQGGVSAWKERYTNLMEKAKSPPGNGERLVIEQWDGYCPGRIYLRQGNVEEVLSFAKRRIAREKAAYQQQLSDVRDRDYGRRNREY